MAYKFWVGQPTSAEWTTPTNWSPAGAPNIGDVDIDYHGLMAVYGYSIDQQAVWLNNVIPYGQGGGYVGFSLTDADLGRGTSLLLVAQAGPIGVVLHNANLYGRVLALSGANIMAVDAGTSAVNWGIITAYGSYPTSLAIYDAAAFTNMGYIGSENNGRTTLVFGGWNAQYIGNMGEIQADTGGTTIIMDNDTAPSRPATLVNYAGLGALGGVLDLKANVVQIGQGQASIQNNGTLLVESPMSGGVINIQSGTLEFGPEALGTPSAPSFAHFSSQVDFTGTDGTIEIGYPSLADVLLEQNSDGSQYLHIDDNWKGYTVNPGNIELTGRTYTQAMFSVNNSSGNSMIVFHAATAQS